MSFKKPDIKIYIIAAILLCAMTACGQAEKAPDTTEKDIRTAEWPVSLSEKAHTIFREELGFGGVIIADDIWMIDKDKLGIEEEIAPLALRAGNDMIISTTYERDIAKIHTAIQEGEVSEDRLKDAVLRVLKWKLELGVME